jgi:hypothetical protein
LGSDLHWISGFTNSANAERLELEVKRLAGQLQEFRAPAAKSDQPHPNARLEPVGLSKRNGDAKCNEEHS